MNKPRITDWFKVSLKDDWIYKDRFETDLEVGDNFLAHGFEWEITKVKKNKYEVKCSNPDRFKGDTNKGSERKFCWPDYFPFNWFGGK